MTSKSEIIKRNLEGLVISRALGLFLFNFKSSEIDDLKKQSREFAHVWQELHEVAQERKKQSGWLATVHHTEFYDAFYCKMSYATQALIIEKAMELNGDEARRNIEFSLQIEAMQEKQSEERIERKGQSPVIITLLNNETSKS